MGVNEPEQVSRKTQIGLSRFPVQCLFQGGGDVEQVCRIGSCHVTKIGQWTAIDI